MILMISMGTTMMVKRGSADWLHGEKLLDLDLMCK